MIDIDGMNKVTRTYNLLGHWSSSELSAKFEEFEMQFHKHVKTHKELPLSEEIAGLLKVVQLWNPLCKFIELLAIGIKAEHLDESIVMAYLGNEIVIIGEHFERFKNLAGHRYLYCPNADELVKRWNAQLEAENLDSNNKPEESPPEA